MQNETNTGKTLSADDKEREYENNMADRYNRDYHEPPIMKSHSIAFVKYVAQYIKKGDRVLDLGCASASLWALFRKYFDPSITLVGVDLSPGMLDVAKKTFPDGDFRVGSMTDIPCAAGEFDVVIVSSAFHHINDTKLPEALKEISRVMDEHGILVGREPLMTGRLGDRGGWLAGALMHLRHLCYRLTHTQEFPEPDPGPDHHAYDAKHFVSIVNNFFTLTNIEFRNPVSLFLARSQNPFVVKLALHLDELISHKEGQEIHYASRKNYSEAADVKYCIEKEINDNKLINMEEFLAHLDKSAEIIERLLEVEHRSSNLIAERPVFKK